MLYKFLFIILQILLIIFGIINKRDTRRSFLYLVGCFFLCSFISVYSSPFIGKAICTIIELFGISSEIENTTPLSILSLIILVYICYKLFYVILYWESRPFIGTVSEIIVVSQSPDLPDCSEVVLEEFRNRMLNINKKQINKKDPASGEKNLYIILTNMLSRDKYHSTYRELNDEGKQLLRIRNCCVDYLVEKGAIQETEKEKYLELNNDYYERSRILRSLMNKT